jgi:TRAP transporter TAXI family solute receptor
MRTQRTALALTLALTLLAAAPALAQVGMVTGSKTGTYIQFGKDIATVAGRLGLDIEVKESEGSLDNIERMNSKENAGFGIVQSDVLEVLERRQPQVAERLRLVFPFYNEEVHVFARKTVPTFSALAGKRVAVGTKGSGNWLTAANLFALMGIRPGEIVTDLEPLKAVTAVLEGELDAMVYVAGKPVAIFKKLEELKNNPEYAPLLEEVHFLPLEAPAMLAGSYVPSELTPSDYSWLPVRAPTIAVKALLVSFDFSSRQSAYFNQRCGELSVLGRAIRENLEWLKANGHAKWKRVDLDAEVGRWKRDACVHGGKSPEARAPAGKKHGLYDMLQKEFQ